MMIGDLLHIWYDSGHIWYDSGRKAPIGGGMVYNAIVARAAANIMQEER